MKKSPGLSLVQWLTIHVGTKPKGVRSRREPGSSCGINIEHKYILCNVIFVEICALYLYDGYVRSLGQVISLGQLISLGRKSSHSIVLATQMLGYRMV